MQVETPSTSGRVKVWDLFVRLFHWSLVAVYLVAYTTEDDTLAIHVWAGYAAGGLVLLRILWGFVGTPHARFTDFAYSPFVAWRYLLDLFRFRSRRYIGHSPAGGMMVLILMAGVLATVWSGLEAYAVEEGKGPLVLSAPSLVATALADLDDDEEDDEGDDEDEFWSEFHEVLAHFTTLMVLFHIGGVILASVAHRENLVRSMVTGFKPAETASRKSPPEP